MSTKPSTLDSLRIDRSQAPQGSGRGWWVALVLLLLPAVGAAGWWFSRAKGIVVTTTVVQARSAGGGDSGRTLLNASGYVTTRLEATVSSKVTGKIAEILVEEGMKVEKGQILAKLDASNVESSLRLADARLSSARLVLTESEPLLEFAEAEFKRLTSLESAKAASESNLCKGAPDVQALRAKLQRLKSDVIVAECMVDEYRLQVDDTIIRAPFAGVVTTKDSQPGEMISPMSAGGSFTRTGICTLVDMASLEIEVDVGESFINRVTAGQPVVATLDAYQDWQIPGKVIAIIPTADRQKATVKVRVAFEKLDPRILPQMGVKVAFQSAEPTATAGTAKDVITVSKDAVRSDAGRDIAWVVREGRVERRAVTVAGSNQGEVTLSAGLSPGEVVVLNPPATLTDGSPVIPEPTR